MTYSSHGSEWVKLDPKLEGEKQTSTGGFRYNPTWKKPIRALALYFYLEEQANNNMAVELTVNSVTTADYWSTVLNPATPTLQNRDSKDHILVVQASGNDYVGGWVYIFGGSFVSPPSTTRPSFVGNVAASGRRTRLLTGYLNSDEGGITEIDLKETSNNVTGYAELFGYLP